MNNDKTQNAGVATDSAPAAGSARLLSNAIRKTCRLASLHLESGNDMAPLLIARYGCLPNDVDCDLFIDATDYGLGKITLRELDDEMTRCGFPPNVTNESQGE